jgi:hypothetical protein
MSSEIITYMVENQLSAPEALLYTKDEFPLSM